MAAARHGEGIPSRLRPVSTRVSGTGQSLIGRGLVMLISSLRLKRVRDSECDRVGGKVCLDSSVWVHNKPSKEEGGLEKMM